VAAIKSSLSDLLGQMFDRSYLEADAYLSAVMVSNYGIPFEALVRAPAVQAITTNVNVVKTAINESQRCFMDKDAAVRPWKRAEANTLILRDISSATTTDGDILTIFSSDGDKGACPTPVSVRAEMNDTWFVMFATEADCKDALLAVNLQKRELAGKKVQARLKTTSAKPIYTVPSVAVLPGGLGAPPYSSFPLQDRYFPAGLSPADPTARLDGVHMFQGMPIYPQSSIPFPLHFVPGQIYGGQDPAGNGYMPNMAWPMGVSMPPNLISPTNQKFPGRSGNGYTAAGGHQGGGRGSRSGQPYTGVQKREVGRIARGSRGESLGEAPANLGNLAGADAGAAGGRRMDQGQWSGYGGRPQQPVMDMNGMVYAPQMHMVWAEGISNGNGYMGRSGGRGGRGAGGRGGYNNHSAENSPTNRGNARKMSPRSQQQGSVGEGDARALPGPLMAQGLDQDEHGPTNGNGSANGNGDANGDGAGGRQKQLKDKQPPQPQQDSSQPEDIRAGPGKKAQAGAGSDGAPAASAPHQKRQPQQKAEQAGDASAGTNVSGTRAGSGEATKKKATAAKQNASNASKAGEGAKGANAKAKHAPAQSQPDFNMERDFPTTLGASTAGVAIGGANGVNTSGSVAESSATSEASASSGWAAIARRAQSDAGNQATAAAIQQATSTTSSAHAPAAAKPSGKAAAPSPLSVPAAAPPPAVEAKASTVEIPAIIFGSFGSAAESVSPIVVPTLPTAPAPARPVSTSSQGTQTATSDKTVILTARQPLAQPAAATSTATASTSTTATKSSATNTTTNTAPPAAGAESSATESSVGGAWGVKRSFADVMKVGK